MAKKEEGVKDCRNHYGMLIPAGLLIGIGTGLLIGQVAACTLIGLGFGFAAAYFVGKK